MDLNYGRFFALVVWLATGCSAAVAPSWTGDATLAAQELEATWGSLADERRVVGIRGTLRFALEATGIGWEPARVAVALTRARAMQDLERGSPTRGNFKWRSDHPRVLDLNAVEFASQLLGLMHRRYAAQLRPDVRRQVEEMLTDAIDGLRGHQVRVEYTNIFVMKAWGLIAAGEALERPEVAAEGYARLAEWLRTTARQGVGEYGAVTYYGIDLDSLVMIAKHAGRPEARADARTAIRLLWSDIAANWWAPGDRLGGTNARSYDYLFGRGYLEAHTWTAGWLRVRPQLEGAGWLSGAHEQQSVLRDAVTWMPPADWTEPLRRQMPRIVVQRWGPEPEQRASHWVGRHVSLASSGASRGRDERTLVANLGDSPAVPQIVLFMDGREDPYGTKRVANAAGQAKSLHLTPFIATVQRGPEVLQLLADDPFSARHAAASAERGVTCFLSQLLLPRKAELWFGEKPVDAGQRPGTLPVPAGEPVYVRLGDAVIGIRFVLATAVGGGPAAVRLLSDDPSGVACRLTVEHAARPQPGRGAVAVWLRAAEGLDAAGFSAWRRAFAAAKAEVRDSGDVVRIDVSGLAGTMAIAADLARGERRVLAGGEPEALLSVNGHDIGRELLAPYRD